MSEGHAWRHDVRTPLALIMGYADVLASREEMPDAERREFAERIAVAAAELRDLIDAAPR